MTAQIPLSKGMVALVDDDDVADLEGYRWLHHDRGYAYRSERVNGKLRSIQMHRHLLSPPADMEVDHANGNGLDNRRRNLRVVTHLQNMQNQRRRPGKYPRGVTRGPRGINRYRAVIWENGIRISLGWFSTAEEAGAAAESARCERYTHYIPGTGLTR